MKIVKTILFPLTIIVTPKSDIVTFQSRSSSSSELFKTKFDFTYDVMRVLTSRTITKD